MKLRRRFLRALVRVHDFFAVQAAESGTYCENGRVVKDVLERMRDMKPEIVFGAMSKTSAAALRALADRMDAAKTAFEFADVAGDLSALNVKFLRVSADWAHAETRSTAA